MNSPEAIVPGADSPAMPGLSYAASGVDTGAGDEAVRLIAPLVSQTFGEEVLTGIGGFAGLFALPEGKWRHPVLVASTDGVGTKAELARMTGRYDTIGIDLVAMCVDDVVCTGAEPAFLLDYYSTEHLDPQVAACVVAGVVRGCRQAGCALIGGEMAEHPAPAGLAPGGSALVPGALRSGGGSFDLAGFAVGVVERDAILGPERVLPGDVLVGMASPGLRCNGYSLVRSALLGLGGRSLDGPAWPGAAHSLADELLVPSVIYAPAVVAMTRDVGCAGSLRAVAHITGGGIATNLSRVLPAGCDAVVDRSTWEVPRVFDEVRRAGRVSGKEMDAVFNLGLGMVVVVAPDGVAAVAGAARAHGHDAVVVGRVTPGTGAVRMLGIG